jgi:hypothetical protein
MTTHALAQTARACGLIALVGLVQARGAAAQVDVDSLPGDVKGEKIAFQRNADFFINGFPCVQQTNLTLPASDVTIETVTADLIAATGAAPHVIVRTVLGGVSVDHHVALSPLPVVATAAESLSQSFTATHGVRLHHVSRPDQPLSVLVTLVGSDCFVSGQVTVAGYYKPRPVRPGP